MDNSPRLPHNGVFKRDFCMTTANLTFNAINEALVRINARMDAAECHGTLCGLLCAADRLDYAAWLDRAFPTVDPADALAKEVDQTLKPLYNLALKQISGSSYDLALVLPDDETPAPDHSWNR